LDFDDDFLGCDGGLLVCTDPLASFFTLDALDGGAADAGGGTTVAALLCEHPMMLY